MIDDATSRAVARFVVHDSTEENLRLLPEQIFIRLERVVTTSASAAIDEGG